MDKQYYFDYYTAERKHWFFRARNAIIMQHINDLVKQKPNLRILNVGVATGHTSELLAQFGTVKSVEYDEECFAFTKKQLPNIDLIQGSILELPFKDNSYDIVCAFDVIEHIADDNLGVQEMKRVCKSDGHVVITIPAFMSLWSYHDEINHHFRRYKKSEVENLLTDSGSIQYISYFNSLLFPPVWLFRKLNNILGLSKKRENTSESAGSDLDYFSGGGIISKMLYSIFVSEKALIHRLIKLPFGVSLIASWKKE